MGAPERFKLRVGANRRESSAVTDDTNPPESMDFAGGARCLLEGYRLIWRRGLKRFVLVPLGINAALFTVLIAWLGNFFDRAMERLLPGWLDWLEWLLWPIFALTVLLAGFYAFMLVANFLAAPFNGLLSERVERHLTGREPPEGQGGLAGAVAELPAAIGDELRKLAYFLGWALVLLILVFVPLVNVILPALWFLFGAWTLALEFMDFPLGNHGYDFPRQRAWLRERRSAALGFGTAAFLATLVPVANFALMPAAVAGATLFVTRQGGRPRSY